MALKIKVFTFKFNINALGQSTDDEVTNVVNQFLIDRNIGRNDLISMDNSYDVSFNYQKTAIQSVVIIYN